MLRFTTCNRETVIPTLIRCQQLVHLTEIERYDTFYDVIYQNIWTDICEETNKKALY